MNNNYFEMIEYSRMRGIAGRLVLFFLAIGIVCWQTLLTPSVADAAITATALTSGSGANIASFTTASITPGANKLILLWVYNAKATSTVAPSTVAGNGLTWTQVNTQALGANRRLSLYRAMGAAPTAGTVAIGFGATQQTVCAWSIIEYGGVDTTGTGGSGAIVQNAILASTATATSKSIALAGFASNSNATAAGFIVAANQAITEEAANGYTKTAALPIANATYPSYLMNEFKAGVDTTPSATTIPTQTWAGIGVELRIANDLTIGNGADPGATTTYINGSGYVADSFSMAMSTEGSTVSTLTLTDSGTGSFTTDVSAIRIYHDAGTIGALDGADILVPTTYSATATTATVTFTTPEDVVTSGDKYLVVLDIASGATANNTLIVKVTGASGAVGSPIYSDSTAPTLTVATGNLTVGNGTNPGAASAYINSTNNAINGFTMAVSAGYGKLQTLTLTTSANFTATNVSSIKVYRDNGTTGAYDAGTDTLIPTTYLIGVNTATITFTTPEDITNLAQSYLITVDINSTATTGNTLTAYVSAATGSGLGTKTFSDNTGYPTLTIATGNLTIGNGTNPANNASAYRGNEYGINGFTLAVSAGTAKISALTLTSTNSASTNVSPIFVYRDVGVVGTFEPGTDTLVPVTVSGQTATAATLTFTTPETVTTTAANYLIVYDIANAAVVGTTLTSRVTAVTGSGLGTIVYNDTSSATLTVAQNNLTVGTGTNPANANAYKLFSHAINGFTLQMSAANSTVAQLTLTTTNSAVGNVANIRIYRDAVTLGTLDGSDALVPTTLSGQTATSATLTFDTPEAVLSAAAKNYLIVYDIAEGATVGTTLTARVTAADGYVGVPVYNDTTNATLTIAQGTLTVGAGTNPGNASVPQGSTDKAINGFSLAMSAGASGKVSSLTLINTNSAASNVSNIKIYSDAATVGTLDGADTLIPSAYSISSATAAIVDLDTPESVTSTAKNYLIVYDIANGATVTNTMTSRVSAVSGSGLGTPVYNDTTSATLTVVAGVCTRTAPAIEFDTGSALTYGQARAGLSKEYILTVTNKDNNFCGSSTFSIGLGSETGTTASFNLPSALAATSTGALTPGGKFSTSFTVSAKTAGAIADSITSAINVTDSTNHAAQPGSASIKTYINDPLLHNSISTGSGKWSGSWGVAGGQYGAFTCNTCHTQKSTNIARIKPALATPGGTVNFQSKVFANSFGVYSSTVSNSQAICETCHTATTYHKGTMASIVSHGNEAQTRNCSLCHEHKRGFKPIGGCTGCHSYEQRGRGAVVNQLTGGQSHHIQGVPVTDKLCYQCHWEANSDGTVNLAKHGGSINSNQPVNLVVYQNGVRPTTADATTEVAYTANGSRTQLATINNHCLGCHNAGSAASQPFGDGKTPKQYAWDALSIDERYSQAGRTTWGKYSDSATTNVTPKNTQTKAYSAHGSATANKRGWDLNEAWPNTSGSVKVLCYDCHNSHGSTVSGVTSNYSSATGKYKGAILKDTTAGKGGYAVTYKPQAGGSAATKDAYNPGAGICFDCHNTQTASSKPWGYSDTYGSSQPVLGYWDTPYFTNGTFAATQRYTYKGLKSGGNQGGHFGKSSAMNTTPTASINGLCTPCHDPHGVSPTLGANMPYGVPLLKNTWLTSPYLEDSAPATPPGTAQPLTAYNRRGGGDQPNTASINTFVNGHIPNYHIDQNTFGPETYPVQGLSSAAGGVSGATSIKWDFTNTTNRVAETTSQFAGLCLNCHTQASIAPNAAGAAPAWKSMARIHNTVKGWGSTGTGNAGNAAHSYTCSKCHTVHNYRLPRLMVTNCLNYDHRGQIAGPATAPPKNTITGNNSAGGGGGFPSGGGGVQATSAKAPPSTQTGGYYGEWFFGSKAKPTGYRTCHDVSTAGGTTYPSSHLWNTKTPW